MYSLPIGNPMDSMGRPIGFLRVFIKPIGFLYHTVLAAEKIHRVGFGGRKKSIGLVFGGGRKVYGFLDFSAAPFGRQKTIWVF